MEAVRVQVDVGLIDTLPPLLEIEDVSVDVSDTESLADAVHDDDDVGVAVPVTVGENDRVSDGVPPDNDGVTLIVDVLVPLAVSVAV